MPITEANVQASLRALLDPNTGRDFVSTKSIRKIQVDGGNVAIDVLLPYPAKTQHEALRKLVHNHLASMPGAVLVICTWLGRPTSQLAVSAGK